MRHCGADVPTVPARAVVTGAADIDYRSLCILPSDVILKICSHTVQLIAALSPLFDVRLCVANTLCDVMPQIFINTTNSATSLK